MPDTRIEMLKNIENSFQHGGSTWKIITEAYVPVPRIDGLPVSGIKHIQIEINILNVILYGL